MALKSFHSFVIFLPYIVFVRLHVEIAGVSNTLNDKTSYIVYIVT